MHGGTDGGHVVHMDGWMDGHAGMLAGAVCVGGGCGHRQSCRHVGMHGWGMCAGMGWHAWVELPGGVHSCGSMAVSVHGWSGRHKCMHAWAPEPPNFETQLDLDYDEFHG